MLSFEAAQARIKTEEENGRHEREQNAHITLLKNQSSITSHTLQDHELFSAIPVFLNPLLYLTYQHLPPSPTQLHSTNHSTTPHLTITLLVPRPRARAPKLLRLAPPVIRDQQRAIVLHERLLQLVLGVLVHVLLVVGDDALGDRLADGVDLRRVPAAGDAHADVDRGELVEAEDEEGFVDLCGSEL